MAHNQARNSLDMIRITNVLLIIITVVFCSILMLVNVPGLELLETNPNWLLIWLVAWSMQRSIWQGAIAGLALGWICDGIIAGNPSHAWGFMIVGILTASLQKQRYVGEDFISIALIVFFMTFVAETIFALQYARAYLESWVMIWPQYQHNAIVTAIITSLWSPVFYYLFQRWEQKKRQWQRKISR